MAVAVSVHSVGELPRGPVGPVMDFVFLEKERFVSNLQMSTNLSGACYSCGLFVQNL